MRKSVWKKRPISETLPPEITKPDAINKESFPAYSIAVEEEVLQALMTGSTANLFYSTAEENIADFINCFEKSDAKQLAQSIVYAREKGFTRTIPIAATVVLSKKDTALFKKIVHRVVLNPHDWKQFIDICRSKTIRQGIGRALKREINNDILKMSTYHTVKYASDVYDMINIARPNSNTNKKVIDYIKTENYLNYFKPDDKIFEGVKLFKETSKDNEDELAKIIKDYRLPYQFVVGEVKPTLKIKEALLYVAPYFNLVRNLNSLGRDNIFANKPNRDYAINTLTNPKAIEHSKLFPFRFYVAWNNIEYWNGHDEIKHALLRALEISIKNVPTIKEKVCIAPDVSGSMNANVLADKDKSVVQCIDLVGLFTGIIKNKCEQPPIILPFEYEINFALADKINLCETIFETAKLFQAGGGTSLSAPVRFLRANREHVDRIIAFTDAEEWVGSSFVEEFVQYRREINPNCKAYLVKLIPSRTQPTPPRMRDVHFVYGWNDNVLSYTTSNLTNQLEEVNKIEI